MAASGAPTRGPLRSSLRSGRDAGSPAHVQSQPSRARERLRAFVEATALHQRVGDELFQILGPARRCMRAGISSQNSSSRRSGMGSVEPMRRQAGDARVLWGAGPAVEMASAGRAAINACATRRTRRLREAPPSSDRPGTEPAHRPPWRRSGGPARSCRRWPVCRRMMAMHCSSSASPVRAVLHRLLPEGALELSLPRRKLSTTGSVILPSRSRRRPSCRAWRWCRRSRGRRRPLEGNAQVRPVAAAGGLLGLAEAGE